MEEVGEFKCQGRCSSKNMGDRKKSAQGCLTVLAFIPGVMGPEALSQIELLVTEALYLEQQATIIVLAKHRIASKCKEY